METFSRESSSSNSIRGNRGISVLICEMNDMSNPELTTNEQVEAVMARMVDNKLTCPDCGVVLNVVTVEQFRTKPFVIDYDKKELTASGEEWVPTGGAFRCPKCDTLNVDDLFKKFSYDIDEAG